MATNLSDVFRSDSNDSEGNADVNSDSNLSADSILDNEGISLSSENTDGDESSSFGLDVGGTGVGDGLDAGNTVDSLLGGSTSSESTETVE